MRGKTFESFFISITNSLAIDELKKTNALQKEKQAWKSITESQDEIAQTRHNIKNAYFLYKGVLPDMSDKNIITLPTKKKRPNQ